MRKNNDNPTQTNPNQPEEKDTQTTLQSESIEAGPVRPSIETVTHSQESKNMAILCHLLSLFTGFIGPLILWIIKKDEDKWISNHAKEALNFQITIIILMITSAILAVIFIGILLWIVTCICDLLFCILACIAASKGEDYRYPVSLRVIR